MDETPRTHGRATDLGPAIARLEDLARKLEGMGKRNRELPDMAVRLREVAATLRSGDAGDPSKPYRDLARSLFPAARLCESLGLQSMAREILHVERTLEAMAPPAPAADAPLAVRRAPTSSGEATSKADPEPAPTPAIEEPPPQRRISPALLLAALAVVVTVAVCATVIIRHDPLAGSLPPTATPTAVAAVPTPLAPAPTPTMSAVEIGRLARRQQLLDETSLARRALQGGDPVTALRHLDAAALVDPVAGLVLEIAGEIVAYRILQAERAMDRASWQEAEGELEAAATLSRRFGLDPGRVEALEFELARVVRYRLIGPGERAELLDAVGLVVEVIRDRGVPLRGVLDRLEGEVLVLRTDRKMSGGSILYHERIPLDDVRFVKAYPSSPTGA